MPLIVTMMIVDYDDDGMEVYHYPRYIADPTLNKMALSNQMATMYQLGKRGLVPKRGYNSNYIYRSFESYLAAPRMKLPKGSIVRVVVGYEKRVGAIPKQRFGRVTRYKKGACGNF